MLIYNTPDFPDLRYFDTSPSLIRLAQRQAERADTLTLCEALRHLRALLTRRNRVVMLAVLSELERRNRVVMLAVLSELERRDPRAFHAWMSDFGPHIPSPAPYFSV